MVILAFDTATENCSCALSTGTDISERCEFAPQQHARLLLPMIDSLLADNGVSRSQLDAIVFGRGPGSFTGLRIAAAAAQGIALGLGLPVMGISTLQAMAHQNFRQHAQTLTLSCIDARMSEVYWGAYETSASGQSRLLGEEQVSGPNLVEYPDERDWQMVGSGVGSTASGESVVTDLLPQAVDMLMLAAPLLQQGQGIPADQAIPVYLRNKVALTEAERAEQKKSSV